MPFDQMLEADRLAMKANLEEIDAQMKASLGNLPRMLPPTPDELLPAGWREAKRRQMLDGITSIRDKALGDMKAELSRLFVGSKAEPPTFEELTAGLAAKVKADQQAIPDEFAAKLVREHRAAIASMPGMSEATNLS